MKIELAVHAVNLKNVAGVFKGTSDPFVIATKIATAPGTKPVVIGKSEVIKNNLNPKWVHVFVTDYDLGTTTKVAFSIFDEVRKGDNKSMGSAIFDVAEVLAARGSTRGKKLRCGGTLYVHAQKSQGSGVLRLTMRGEKLKNMEGLFSKSDPFYELSRRVDAAGGLSWNNVYRSEDIRNNLNPEWTEASIDLSILCGGDMDLPIRMAVFDHESSGKHKMMGELDVTVNALVSAAKRNVELKLKRKGKNTGIIHVVKADVSDVESATQEMSTATISTPSPAPAPAPTSQAPRAVPSSDRDGFIDYIAGGCRLNAAVAIDFTGSNGDPRKPGTLHYLNPSQANDYEKAISAIVSILAKYDSDQMFPVYGFGAKYGGVVRHCFQCGGAEEHHGVSGVLKAYKSVFKSGLIMSAPTVFTEVIDTVAAHARAAQEKAMARGGQCYTVLLILTDGAVSDVQATARSLAQASDAPLSIVIVGVGTADFSAMHFLDDFDGGHRDNAQFVEFNKYRESSQMLTSMTLDEIPEQLTGYFKSRGIPPSPPLQRNDSQISIGVEDEEEIDLTLDFGEEEIVVASGGDDFVDGFQQGR